MFDEREIHMLLGERRRIILEVTMEDSDAFIISAANFEVCRGALIADSGTAEIDGHKITVWAEPPASGLWQLTVTFCIGGETVKKRVFLRVEE